jgi:hypothetical protein
MNASAQPSSNAFGSVGEAEQTILNLGRVMDTLIETVEQETALVRAGKLTDAEALASVKAELAGHYLATTERLKASRQFVSRNLPDALANLRRRHDAFHAILQMNLTVLATAHAVSEGIVRGVSDEINRTQVPQTYGATGRASAAQPKNRQPMAINRAL